MISWPQTDPSRRAVAHPEGDARGPLEHSHRMGNSGEIARRQCISRPKRLIYVTLAAKSAEACLIRCINF